MSEKDLVERALRLLDEYGAGGGKPARRMLSPEEVRAHNEKAREDLDHFFTAAVMPGLTRIHAEGKLPTLDVPEWEPIDREWAKASEGSPVPCDAEKVKTGMRKFIEARAEP